MLRFYVSKDIAYYMLLFLISSIEIHRFTIKLNIKVEDYQCCRVIRRNSSHSGVILSQLIRDFQYSINWSIPPDCKCAMCFLFSISHHRLMMLIEEGAITLS